MVNGDQMNLYYINQKIRSNIYEVLGGEISYQLKIFLK